MILNEGEVSLHAVTHESIGVKATFSHRQHHTALFERQLDLRAWKLGQLRRKRRRRLESREWSENDSGR